MHPPRPELSPPDSDDAVASLLPAASSSPSPAVASSTPTKADVSSTMLPGAKTSGGAGKTSSSTHKRLPISFFMMSGDSLAGQQQQRRGSAASASSGSVPSSPPLPSAAEGSGTAATTSTTASTTASDLDASAVHVQPHVQSAAAQQPAQQPAQQQLQPQQDLRMPLASIGLSLDSSMTISDFGVQSLVDAMSVAEALDPAARPPSSSSSSSQESVSSRPISSAARRLPRPPSVNTISMPLTPVFARSPVRDRSADGVSTPRSTSLQSFRLGASDAEDNDDDDLDDDSDACENRSQAITSGSEGEDGETGTAQSHDDGASPQLVMPSVIIPKRRAFTDRGRQMGKLKIMVVGAKGSGKSSLIKSLVQTCEDIVHVDPVDSSPSRMPNISFRAGAVGRRPSTGRSRGTEHITEIYASTKAYPSWWNDIEESKLLKRRKSFNDTVLERNICFVDTPGFDVQSSTHAASEAIVGYVQNLLHRSASLLAMSKAELLSLMAGHGGLQVDAILFLLSKDADNAEMTLFRRLASLTNVIPVLSKSDLLSSEHCAAAKSKILRRLQAADIRPFLFDRSSGDIIAEQDSSFPPYAVSSILSSTDDTMDASLLMSPDYSPPLHGSDLPDLVSRVFEPSAISWLRHAAAKKLLTWRQSNNAVAPSMSTGALQRLGVVQPQQQSPPQTPAATGSSLTASSIAASSLSPSAVLVSHNDKQVVAASMPSYTMSRLADQTAREERLAQVRLARWASDLQRALRNERERFALLQDAERRRWLRERLDECVSPSALEFADGHESSGGVLMRLSDVHNTKWRNVAQLDPHDPLGVLAWKERVRWRVGHLATFLGSAGLAGAMVLCCIRYFEWHAAGLWEDGEWSSDRTSLWARLVWG